MKGPIVLAVGFVVFIVTAKDVPALYVHEPWQDDPYDAVISFAFLGVPLLTGLSALRVEMCRRAEALPARRVLDLLRLSRVLIAVIALTLGSEWVSVALGVHGEAWTPVTNIVLAVLAALSALTVAAGWQLRRASRACGRTPAPQQPDWLADAAALAKRELTGLGSWGTRFAPVLDWVDRQVLDRVRRPPAVVRRGLLGLGRRRRGQSAGGPGRLRSAARGVPRRRRVQPVRVRGAGRPLPPPGRAGRHAASRGEPRSSSQRDTFVRRRPDRTSHLCPCR